MKFAKELERDAVPEWRIKYLDYKTGKKHVKAVTRALVRTPRSFNNARPSPSRFHPNRLSLSEILASVRGRPHSEQQRPPPHLAGELKGDDSDDVHDGASTILSPTTRRPSQPRGNDTRGGKTSHPETNSDDELSDDWSLPAPALGSNAYSSRQPSRPAEALRSNFGRLASANRRFSFAARSSSQIFSPAELPRRCTGGSKIPESPSHLRRILTNAPNNLTRQPTGPDADMQGYLDFVREREREFYRFMDLELDKVEKFYRAKEEQAGQRLALLRDQLHEWRSRRISEITCSSQPFESSYFKQPVFDTTSSARASADARASGRSHDGADAQSHNNKSGSWVHPIKAKIFPPGPNSKALRLMPQTPGLPPSESGQRRDYVRARHHADVSYRTAKRKLKLALQEFYRSLELLKSYAMLNRTAFRKLNKKLDKAGFVNSDVLDGHIRAVEDLYSRYFERGNHKLAAGKLRSLSKKSTDESGSSFLNGFLIGTGIVFTTQGLAYGMQLLHHKDPLLQAHTGYLLQIYAGYFMVLLLFALFCGNCFVWTRSKVNYPFIFEFDPRSHLDWRRLAEFSSFFLLLLGIFMWMNFSRFGNERMYLWYPVLLVIITALIIFFPAPVLAHKSRKWFIYAHWRLLLAGLYPVEFRDFFLGDMYCSLTYSMANLELFFCLYAHRFNEPKQCNSSHSRLMGFFMTLPAIWRFLQCLRRYHDTRNVFPHLVNGGKYIVTVLSYITLSMYRIDGSHTNLALYITAALINSIYTSIWDLFMDFSLLQPHSRRFLLRDILAFKSRSFYYCAIVADPLLRFAWIFYAIYTHHTQHSTFISFMVCLMEVLRRGLWSLLRVENEHCANVAQYKASRDVPLPYAIEPLMARASETPSPVLETEEQIRLQQQQAALPKDHQPAHTENNGSPTAKATTTTTTTTTATTQFHPPPRAATAPSTTTNLPSHHSAAKNSAAVAGAYASTLGNVRRRGKTSSAQTFSRIIAEAHRQDFEKRRRRPPTLTSSEGATEQSLASDEDDFDDDDDDVDYDDDDEEMRCGGRGGGDAEAVVGLRGARMHWALSRQTEETEVSE